MAALCTGRLDMIARAMKDALHQPYRAPLVPGLGKILAEATEHGALGVALSGAGPTMLALVDRDSSRKAELERFMRGTLQQEGIEATTMWSLPAKEGVQVEPVAAGDDSRAFWEKLRSR
ncbi:hypothetical protein LJK87_25205 [Paenibacillus sp. P25]|nr:hypothetical protein LJK87_25205 [Paenibacillus sp. P25]